MRSSSRVRKTVQAINNNPENFESDESPDLVSDSDDSEDSESSDSDDEVSLNQLKAKRAEKPSKKVLKRRRQVANQKHAAICMQRKDGKEVVSPAKKIKAKALLLRCCCRRRPTPSCKVACLTP